MSPFKVSILFLFILLLAAFMTSSLIAQQTVTTTATVNIVKGLNLEENSGLNFGSMSIPTSAVNVILTTSNDRIASSPGSIELLGQAPVAQNASYTISGSKDATYAITLPMNGTVTLSSGADQINVVDFHARPASANSDALTGTLNSSGIDRFSVGATLELGNSQPYGVYSGSFNINVNYN